LIALRPAIARLLATLRRFGSEHRAAAAVEFALIMPFLITLYLGTIEISDLIAVDRRVNVLAGTVGDLVARSDGAISTAELSGYFDAAEGIILPYSRTGLKQVVTLVEVSSAGVTKVKWSVPNNGGTAKIVNATYPLPIAMINISKGSWVVVSEGSYSYKPLLGWVVKNAINLHRESYYLPRFGNCITYNNGGCT
jgi:Flp pilus assembly protein TadG